MKLSELFLEDKRVNLSLTREETRKVTSMVMTEYGDLTLETATNNEELIAEVSANVAFYSFLKEEAYKDKDLKEAIETGFPVIDAMISFFGGIKDFLTSTDFGKWIAKKIKQFADKFFPKLEKDPNSWTNKLVKFVQKLSRAVGAKGIAWLLAAKKAGKEAGGIAKFLKFKRPSVGQIKAAIPLATKIYKGLMLILIGIAVIKLLVFVAPFFQAVMAKSIVASVTAAASKAGVGGFTLAGFNVIGMTKKIEHYKDPHHLHSHSEEVNSEINDVVREISDLADSFA